MPRSFRKKGQSGGTGDDDPLNDDITIASGWSKGGSSVSDRIIGRMKKNLSFGSGGSARNLVHSSSSVASRKSTGGVNRRRARSRNVRSTMSVDGDKDRNRLHNGQTSRRYKSGDTTPSMASVSAMEEMDSTEAMALKGNSWGRRRDLHRKSQSQRKLHEQPKNNGIDPVEYSLSELRSMNELELEDAMRRACVPSEDILSTLNEAAKIDNIVGTVAEDQRRNFLVAFFVNSGHVKLVPKDSKAKRHPLSSSLKSDGVGDSCPLSSVIFDVSSVRSSISKSQSKKSKLDKIAELKSEVFRVKRENKSLKKTVKKLSVQLEVNDKDSSLQSIGENNDRKGGAKSQQDAEKSEAHYEQQPPYDVVVHNEESGSTKSGKQSKGSDKTVAKNIEYRQKYKKEKEDHINTEFRLQAEIEILTKEVDGLQRELGLSLESLDYTKKRARESRESASNLRHELRNASTKVKELTAEAEARDKLIETFSKILMQKVGLGGEGRDTVLSGDICESLEGEEKLGDGVMMGQSEASC